MGMKELSPLISLHPHISLSGRSGNGPRLSAVDPASLAASRGYGMRKLFLVMTIAVLGVTGPALAQDYAKQRLAPEAKPGQSPDQVTRSPAEEEQQLQHPEARVMEWALPFLDGQTLRYFSAEGALEGTARRHRLAIEFYDAEGKLIARARRVSQAATVYYSPDGTYLGRKLNRRLVTQQVVTNYGQGDNHGFLQLPKPPGEDDNNQ
jgi:hypothetical protein